MFIGLGEVGRGRGGICENCQKLFFVTGFFYKCKRKSDPSFLDVVTSLLQSLSLTPSLTTSIRYVPPLQHETCFLSTPSLYFSTPVKRIGWMMKGLVDQKGSGDGGGGDDGAFYHF